MILADVDAGSNTPSMVGKLLAWRHQNPALAEPIWTALNQHNTAIQEALEALQCLSMMQDYAEVIKVLSRLTVDQVRSFRKAHTCV
jgi:phosphomevalonate kinase